MDSFSFEQHSFALHVRSLKIHYTYNLLVPSYNSVFFQMMGVNKVQFLSVNKEFFTNNVAEDFNKSPGVWGNIEAKLQKDLLDGQYLNRTAFENITDKECRSRYNAEFIQVGSGIGVFNLSLEDNMLPNSSIKSIAFGFGRLVQEKFDFIPQNFSCKWSNFSRALKR